MMPKLVYIIILFTQESTGAQDLDAQTAGGDNLMDLTDPPPPAKTKR
jgi:hypothetical protein